MDIDSRRIDSLVSGRMGDAFAFLGPHNIDRSIVLRCYLPGAQAVEVLPPGGGKPLGKLEDICSCGLFVGNFKDPLPKGYILNITWPSAQGTVQQQTEDPYSFGLLLGDMDLYLIAEGRHWELGKCLGAQPMTIDGVAGTRFAVWAPNARRVSVVGDFNSWDGRRHLMRLRHNGGVWEIFIPRLGPGEKYKYEIIDFEGVRREKADPIARATEVPPQTASVVADNRPFHWTDSQWMAQRAQKQSTESPISIYEVHAGSWLRLPEENNRSLDWDELGERLIPYVVGMGFTHVQFMPIMEHPFGGSWGYQPLSLFAPSARFGTPEGFARFVDSCHNAGLGVILDWVPAHFPADSHGLARFDGTALYEHEDPREGYHQDWNTLIYNMGRNEVRGFIVASALEWLERYHVDGIRIDAVASMLYRDYSRKEGEWIPNIYGGRENLEAVEFLRILNEAVRERHPDALMIAEDSTAWPGVTRPVSEGGLGFTYKWNMGWMHDTLNYVHQDPIYRRFQHNNFTFGLVYAFSENFVLPISHDEVVYGKGSLFGKMPGDEWQKFANLRAYLSFMWTHPGKKLIFMGSEFGQRGEWNHDGSPEWHLLDDPRHRSVQRLVRDLNLLYAHEPALHGRDTSPEGFEWLIADDTDNSVFVYLRKCPNAPPLMVAVNMTPVPRTGYRVSLHGNPAYWQEIFNSDAGIYGGSNIGNDGATISAQSGPDGQYFVSLTLPPLAAVILKAND